MGLDSRNGLADMSLLIHGKQRETKEHDSLMAGMRFGLGVGQLSYGRLMEAGRALSRLATTGDPRGSEATGDKPEPSAASVSQDQAEQSRTRRGRHRQSWPSSMRRTPRSAMPCRAVGRLEDVQAVETNGYYHITTRMRAEPDRLKAKYPNFAKHMKKLNDVLLAKVRVLDDQGRDVIRLTVDSEKLLFGVECYVKDGQVLPFDDNQVYESEPLDTLAGFAQVAQGVGSGSPQHAGHHRQPEEPAHRLRVRRARLVHGDRLVTSRPCPRSRSRAAHSVCSRPGFLDVFISSNIQEITEEFFKVAVKGNDGKGVESHIELGSRTDGAPGVFSMTASLEVMESWIIKFGGSVVTDRLMMNKKAEDEAKQLAADLHDAFVKDLGRFEKKVGGAG